MSDLPMESLGAVPAERRSGNRLAPVVHIARLMLARFRERRALASLDARMLRDIGITPYEAGVEAGKPFWRP